MPQPSTSVSQVSDTYPSAIALRAGSAMLTYADLNVAANRVANYLVSLGVTPGTTVAICEPRSFHQIIAVLAVMRCRGTFLPMDTAWPHDRMRHVIQDSGASVFMGPDTVAQQLALDMSTISMPRDADAIAAQFPTFPELPIRPEDIAYLMYTSGSTGTPKGVEITNENLSNLISWHNQAFHITPADRASHIAGLGFDASVWEVWPYLSAGASISLVDEAARISPQLLQQWLVENDITVAFVPTPLAEPMLHFDWPSSASLRLVLTGGDALHAIPRSGLPFTLVNNYGPTECTVVASSGLVSPETQGVPTLGKAITGVQLYVVDEHGALAPTGRGGELYIGGLGVGRGYRNLPELTAQCFVPDYFSGKPGHRLYKTGDFVTMLPDGQLTFQGRADGQVKIRGQRLELEEIICVLNRHPSIAFSTVVVCGEDVEDKHLAAYVNFAGSTSPTSRELREHLASALPAFMIPSVFVRLESIPLNESGKLDRKRLAPPTSENILTELAQEASCSPLEQRVLDIIRTVLKTNQVGVDDDFFLVGGHSLLGTQLVKRIRDAFRVNLTMRDLFDAATTARLAIRVESLLLAEIESMSEDDAAEQAAN